MEESCAPEASPSREEQVRTLGFDPSYLTAEEQEELLEMQRLCPDELLTV